MVFSLPLGLAKPRNLHPMSVWLAGRKRIPTLHIHIQIAPIPCRTRSISSIIRRSERRKKRKKRYVVPHKALYECMSRHTSCIVCVCKGTYLHGHKTGTPELSRRHWSCPRKMSCCIVLARYGTATAGERRQAATNVGPKRKKGRSNWDFCLLFRVSRQDRTGRLSHPFPPGNQGHTSGKY